MLADQVFLFSFRKVVLVFIQKFWCVGIHNAGVSTDIREEWNIRVRIGCILRLRAAPKCRI